MKQKRKLGRPPKSDGHHRRKEILAAALDLFSTHGFEATSIREIAKQVGISDPALYSHFESKQQILEELFKIHGPLSVYSASMALDKSRAMNAPRDFAIAALSALAERWFQDAENKFFRLMLIENLTGNIPSSLTLEAVQKPMKDTLMTLAKFLMKTGVSIKTDPEWMTLQFMTPISHLRTQVALDQSKYDVRTVKKQLNEHLDRFIDVFLPNL